MQSKQKAAACHFSVSEAGAFGQPDFFLRKTHLSIGCAMARRLHLSTFSVWNSLSTIFQKEEPTLQFSPNLLIARGSGRGRDEKMETQLDPILSMLGSFPTSAAEDGEGSPGTCLQRRLWNSTEE